MNILLKIDLASYARPGDPRRSRLFKKLVLETHFEAMTRANVVWLKAHSRAPLLYRSGVRYERDPRKCDAAGRCITETWLDYPSLLRRGAEDCESLSAALAAELRVRVHNSVGVKRRPAATVVLKTTRKPGLWHAVVKDLATGEIFDPSRKLGMGKHE